MSAPGPAEPVDLGPPGPARSQFCRVRYDGPAALLAVLTGFLRDGDVTLASVYVEGGACDPRRSGRPSECERLALTLLCRGSPASVEAVVRCFLRSFEPQVGLRIEG